MKLVTIVKWNLRPVVVGVMEMPSRILYLYTITSFSKYNLFQIHTQKLKILKIKKLMSQTT